MKTKHAPYSLYKKRIGTRYFWYVRFWDERERTYAAHRATGIEVCGKKGRRDEAALAANALLSTIYFCATGAALIAYLKSFWTIESPYFKEFEMTRGRKISAYYLKSAQDIIRLHIEAYPPFQIIRLSALTPSLLRDYMLWQAERGVSGYRINRALDVIRIPLRYAIIREEINSDPFLRVKPAFENLREKGALTQAEEAALISIQYKDVYKRLCVLLGLSCGMRLGEVRGVCWEDVDFDAGLLHIRHNWQNLEGMKIPKYGSIRDVPLFPHIAKAIKAVGEKSEKSEGLIFLGKGRDVPFSVGYFRKTLIAALENIGIPKEEQVRRNLSFHSLRHSFVSLGKLKGLNDSQMQALSGQKDINTMYKYNHPDQVVDVHHCGRILEEAAKQINARL